MHLSAEELIGLPRTEGSKSFDMEINNLNNIGIKHYSLNELEHAEKSLKKATNLAQQLRDPDHRQRLGICFRPAQLEQSLSRR